MYNLQYRKQNGKYHKSLQVSQFGEARIVLRDLEEDQTYLVTVRGVTKEGRYGPESDQKSGVPVNKSLKPAEITGISVAVLVGVIFAGVGLFCVLRRCKKKAQTVIKQAGAITIPDAPDHEIFSSFGRQDSNDSGFDLTPSPDEGVKGNKLSSNPFVLPNDYRFATIGNGELEGIISGSINVTDTTDYEST
ncbi:uncharacterized protein LOC123524169 isoform X2 [Mercenaria mercenaria]|uniref:uncharacterized protein LOC123524169 isoform X2 n=1 Tax=Mercenaria mercenaria TaxID=6596 RepID=UPI00234F0CC7|nr:uncharacterized protein LOC123524169 isoform X2 [Mercenaria mercenaria]